MKFQNHMDSQGNPPEHFQVSYRELSRRRHARFVMTTSLIMTDLASLVLSFGVAILLRSIFSRGEPIVFSMYIKWIPTLLLFILAYALTGLYPTVGVSPVDELRLLAKATSTVFIIFMALSFWLHAPAIFSPLFFLLVWPLTLVLTQLDRWLLRFFAREFGIWGEAAVIIGTGPQTEYVRTYIIDSIRLGLRPVASIDGYWTPDESLPLLLKKTGIHTAILIISEMSQDMKDRIIDHRQYGFQRLIMIPSLEWVYSLGVATYDLEGILGLEVQQKLLNPWERFLKRSIDLFLAIFGGIVISPFLLLIASLIRLDSPGRIIYKHERIGRDGRTFKTCKFRTMVSNADQVLPEHLTLHPDLKAEWEANRKLKNDPRITRIGKLLRTFSLDELPQIWNVLKGEMSIVGPRPIVDEETDRYSQTFALYKLVRPGMTGLWQVSGRSNRGYRERVRYDEYYIRNWSIWLDIYIMLRTVWVLLSHHGAY